MNPVALLPLSGGLLPGQQGSSEALASAGASLFFPRPRQARREQLPLQTKSPWPVIGSQTAQGTISPWRLYC